MKESDGQIDIIFNILMNDKKLLRKVITSLVDLSDFIEGISTYGSIFCPFHKDESHPSAKVFNDDDGVQRLYCWAENKQYDAYDYVDLLWDDTPLNFLKLNIDSKDIIKAYEYAIGNTSSIDTLTKQDFSFIDDAKTVFLDKQKDLLGYLRYYFDVIEVD